MHQLDNLSKLLRENLVERPSRERRNRERLIAENDKTKILMIIASLAVGGLGIFLFKGVSSRN